MLNTASMLNHVMDLIENREEQLLALAISIRQQLEPAADVLDPPEPTAWRLAQLLSSMAHRRDIRELLLLGVAND